VSLLSPEGGTRRAVKRAEEYFGMDLELVNDIFLVVNYLYQLKRLDGCRVKDRLDFISAREIRKLGRLGLITRIKEKEGAGPDCYIFQIEWSLVNDYLMQYLELEAMGKVTGGLDLPETFSTG